MFSQLHHACDGRDGSGGLQRWQRSGPRWQRQRVTTLGDPARRSGWLALAPERLVAQVRLLPDSGPPATDAHDERKGDDEDREHGDVVGDIGNVTA